MKRNPDKRKAVIFKRARVKNPVGYCLGNKKIQEVSSCKYLGIILRSELKVGGPSKLHSAKGWKALHFVTRVHK